MSESDELNPTSWQAQAPSPSILISILNWNGWRDTVECLESVRRLDYPNHIAVVVDNGSSDDSAGRLRAWAAKNLPESQELVECTTEEAAQGREHAREEAADARAPRRRLVLVRSHDNLGFAGGNNVAIQYALQRPHPADYVFLLNNDATVAEDCLTRLVEVAAKSGAGIVGAVMKERANGRVQFAGLAGSLPLLRLFFRPLLKFRDPAPDPADTFYSSFSACGGAMMIHRDVLESVRRRTGHFLDDDLFLYFEEVDFCGRARQLGYDCVMAAQAVVYHGEASSSGGRYNPIAYYYTSRNRTRVARHLLPWPLRLLFHGFNIPQCLGRVAVNLARGRRDAAKAIFRGALDGYRGVSGKWKDHDQAFRNKSAGYSARA